MAGIDDWLPRFDVGERHEIAVVVGPFSKLIRRRWLRAAAARAV